MPGLRQCFFCEKPPESGYESNDRFLWLCESHWRIIADTMLDELESKGLIENVDYVG